MIVGEDFASKLKVMDGFQFCGIVDADGYILTACGGYKDTLGFEPKEVIGTRLLERIHPLDWDYLREQRNIMIKSRKPVRCKYEVRNKDGKFIIIRTYVTPLFDGNEFMGSCIQAVKRDIDMEMFRHTHEYTPLITAI